MRVFFLILTVVNYAYCYSQTNTYDAFYNIIENLVFYHEHAKVLDEINFVLANKPKNYRPSFILVGITFLISTLIIVVSPQKNGSEFIFLFAPLAIIITNYIEMVTERWFKEALLLILIFTPILNLIL